MTTSLACLAELLEQRAQLVRYIETRDAHVCSYCVLSYLDAAILHVVAERHGTRLYDDASGTA